MCILSGVLSNLRPLDGLDYTDFGILNHGKIEKSASFLSFVQHIAKVLLQNHILGIICLFSSKNVIHVHVPLSYPSISY